MARRRICVVTGTRAEYGLLRWIMRRIADSESLELQVVATGTHLSHQFGYTVEEIRRDGFAIAAEVHMLVSGDVDVAIAKSAGLGLIGFADAFARLAPDMVVLLGDRYEILAAAAAATLMRLPIAHIHGGEASEGAVDDAIRHAVTKMAHLHFVAAAPYGRRVVQMGEDPARVHVTGAVGLDGFLRNTLPDRDALAQRVGLPLNRPLLLVTYHPATLDRHSPLASLGELLSALDEFPEAAIILTKANADAGGAAINAELERWSGERRDRAVLISSLGQTYYLGALREAAAVIGNSSSGLIEAPAAGVPTVNLGHRQDGRLRSASVIDCPEQRSAIASAIRQALDPAFRNTAMQKEPAYGRPGDAAGRIVAILEGCDPAALLIKHFHSIESLP